MPMNRPAHKPSWQDATAMRVSRLCSRKTAPKPVVWHVVPKTPRLACDSPLESVGSVILCLLTICAAVLTGCSGSSGVPVGKVGGLVTVNGKPVNGGQIMFLPTSSGPAATGVIGSDGRYTLRTFKPGDGAVLGSHEVLIESMPDHQSDVTEDVTERRRASRSAVEIPVKYGIPRKSGLSATVTSGSNAIDFALE